MKRAKESPTLIDNAIIVEECRWCDAVNEPHTPACPCGERYRQVQQLGGVPFVQSNGR